MIKQWKQIPPTPQAPHFLFWGLTKGEFESIIESVVKKASIAPPAVVTKDENPLLTRKEAASYLKISLPTLNAWTKGGKVQAYRIGGNQVRYKKLELENTVSKIRTK
jgi:excisionase family DNA binding protein